MTATPYTPETEFADFNPSEFPNLGTDLDNEFGNLDTTLDGIQADIADVRRADGALVNGIVTQDSLAAEIYAGINTPAVWLTATAYSLRDAVVYSGVLYKCIVAHTSGTFATDLSAAKWELLTDWNDLVDNLGLSDDTPATASGAATAGVGTTASRADHVHAASEEILALFGKITSTISSGTPNNLTARRRHRVTGEATVTLPTMSAGDFVIIEFANTAGTTVTVGRNSQTLDGAAEDDTYVGAGVAGPIFKYVYSSSGAVKREFIGSVKL